MGINLILFRIRTGIWNNRKISFSNKNLREIMKKRRNKTFHRYCFGRIVLFALYAVWILIQIVDIAYLDENDRRKISTVIRNHLRISGIEENPGPRNKLSPPPNKRIRKEVGESSRKIENSNEISDTFHTIPQEQEGGISSLSMDILNLNVSKPDELDEVIKRIIDNLKQEDCLRLSRQLGLTEIDIDDEIKRGERIGPKEVRYKLLRKWQEKNGCTANKNRLLLALGSIGKMDFIRQFYPDFLTRNPEIKIESFHDYVCNSAKETLDKNLEKLQIFLRMHYNNIELPIVSWLEQKILLLDKLYVSLTMYPKREEGQESFVGKNISIEEIFLKVNGEHPHRILVEAPPGFGKTTLTYKLAHDWSKKALYLQMFQMVFIVQLRYYKGRIEEVLMNECGVESISTQEKYELICHFGKRILLLLDGYDELKEDEKLALAPLLKGEKFPDMTVLLTSRTGFCKILTTIPMKFSSTGGFIGRKQEKGKPVDVWQKKIIVKGISKENREMFLEKYFKKDVQKLSGKLKHLMTDNVESMFECPLMLLLLAMLEEDDVEQISTITDLYKTIFNFILRRSLLREMLISEEEEIDLFEANNEKPYFQIIFKFAEFVFKKIRSESLTFGNDLLQHFNGDDKILKMGFLTKNLHFLHHKHVEIYEPVHKTFLEFLSALYLSVLITKYENKMEIFENKLKTFNEYDYFIRYELIFLKFLPGLLGDKASILLNYYYPSIPTRAIFELPLLTMIAETKAIENMLPSVLPFMPLDFEYKTGLHLIEKRIADYGIKEKRIKQVEFKIRDLQLLPAIIDVDVLKVSIDQESLEEFDDLEYATSENTNKQITCKQLYLYIHKTDYSKWKQNAFFINSINAENIHIFINYPENISPILERIVEEMMVGEWQQLRISTLTILRLDIEVDSKCVSLIKYMVENKLILDGLEINTECINELVSLKDSLKRLHSASLNYPNTEEDFSLLMNRIKDCEAIVKSITLYRSERNNEENLEAMELLVLHLYISFCHNYRRIIGDLNEKLQRFYSEIIVLKNTFDFNNQLNNSDQNWLEFSKSLKTYIQNQLSEISRVKEYIQTRSVNLFHENQPSSETVWKELLETISKSHLQDFTLHNFSFPPSMSVLDFDALCDSGRKRWNKLAIGRNICLACSLQSEPFNITRLEFNNKWSLPCNTFNPVMESRIILHCNELTFLRCSDETVEHVLSYHVDAWKGWKILNRVEIIFKDETLFYKVLRSLRQFSSLSSLYMFVDDKIKLSLDPLIELIDSLPLLKTIEIEGYELDESSIIDVSGTGDIYYKDPKCKDHIKDMLCKLFQFYLKKQESSSKESIGKDKSLLSEIIIHTTTVDNDLCNSLIKELLVNDVIQSIILIFTYEEKDMYVAKFDPELCVKFKNFEGKITCKLQKNENV